MATVGLIGGIGSSIAFGSNYIPVKAHKSFDGLVFQWFSAGGIFVVGIIFGLATNTWGHDYKPWGLTVFHEGLLGGALWSCNNVLATYAIKYVGLGMGYSIFNAVAIVTGCLTVRFGWFGIEAMVPTSNALWAVGLACLTLAFVAFSQLRPTSEPPTAKQERQQQRRRHQRGGGGGGGRGGAGYAPLDTPLLSSSAGSSPTTTVTTTASEYGHLYSSNASSAASSTPGSMRGMDGQPMVSFGSLPASSPPLPPAEEEEHHNGHGDHGGDHDDLDDQDDQEEEEEEEVVVFVEDGEEEGKGNKEGRSGQSEELAAQQERDQFAARSAAISVGDGSVRRFSGGVGPAAAAAAAAGKAPGPGRRAARRSGRSGPSSSRSAAGKKTSGRSGRSGRSGGRSPGGGGRRRRRRRRAISDPSSAGGRDGAGWSIDGDYYDGLSGGEGGGGGGGGGVDFFGPLGSPVTLPTMALYDIMASMRPLGPDPNTTTTTTTTTTTATTTTTMATMATNAKANTTRAHSKTSRMAIARGGGGDGGGGGGGELRASIGGVGGGGAYQICGGGGLAAAAANACAAANAANAATDASASSSAHATTSWAEHCRIRNHSSSSSSSSSSRVGASNSAMTRAGHGGDAIMDEGRGRARGGGGGVHHYHHLEDLEEGALAHRAAEEEAAEAARVAKQVRRRRFVIGILLSALGGAVNANALTPFLLWQARCLAIVGEKGWESCASEDFMFSQAIGIYFASTCIFILYSLGRTLSKTRMPRSVIRPAVFSGMMWGAGLVGQLYCAGRLGYSIAYPLTAIGPCFVSMAWSVFYFREIRGARNLLLLAAALALSCAGLGMIAMTAPPPPGGGPTPPPPSPPSHNGTHNL